MIKFKYTQIVTEKGYLFISHVGSTACVYCGSTPIYYAEADRFDINDKDIYYTLSIQPICDKQECKNYFELLNC